MHIELHIDTVDRFSNKNRLFVKTKNEQYSQEVAAAINENVKVASNRRRSRNNDELSSWSYISIMSMVIPANTTLLEH